MPVNAHPDFLAAEQEYLRSETIEEKIQALKKMISLCPGHKSAENLRAQLKRRLAKLKNIEEKSVKTKKNTRKGIKKEEMRAVIVGEANTGKSSLLAFLTNTVPCISQINFATKLPIVGMMPFSGTYIQLIENPAIESKFYDKGLTHSADSVLILVDKIEQISKILEELKNYTNKKIIVFNKTDLLSEEEKRKLSATLNSKKYNFQLISAKTGERIEELKKKLFKSFDKIRIFTKEPGKEKSPRPIIMNPETTVREVAEKILKGFADKVKETKIWGPSSKFPGQVVGLSHKLKDLDIVEFKTG